MNSFENIHRTPFGQKNAIFQIVTKISFILIWTACDFKMMVTGYFFNMKLAFKRSLQKKISSKIKIK